MAFGFSDIVRVGSLGLVDPEKDRRKAEQRSAAQTASDQAESERLIKQGISEGKTKAEEIYGQDTAQTGEDVREITRMRRERLYGADPGSTNLRESRNRQIRMAKAAGASDEELTQIRRNAERDIANQEYINQGQALSDYQSLIGNILRGQTGMELGYAGLRSGSQQVQAPSTGGALGTVICTELYKQGYMSHRVWLHDQDYGTWVKEKRPHVYYGYLFLARPIVKLMERSKVFTKIVSIPGMAWAKNMAGQYNILGHTISLIGEPLCGLIGRIRYGRSIQSTKN